MSLHQHVMSMVYVLGLATLVVADVDGLLKDVMLVVLYLLLAQDR